MSILTRKLILPGSYYITNKNMILETLVGSCVSVCLYSRCRHISAMNHFINDKPTCSEIENPGKFGSTSIRMIIDELFKMDLKPNEINAQIFGGASVLKNSNQVYDIGRSNLEIAHEYLGRYRVHVEFEATGGNRGRRIKFNTDTFTADCRFSGDIPRKRKK